jgi:uncharacterized protein (DUF362 family)
MIYLSEGDNSVMTQNRNGEVFLLKTSNRKEGIKKLLNQFDLNEYSGKTVALKANFNSADPFPASTHLDTLKAIVNRLKECKVATLTLAERSGMGKTREVLKRMGVLDLSEKLGFNVVVLDEEDKNRWMKMHRN